MMTQICMNAVNDLRHASRSFMQRDLQILDIKHMAEFEEIYRRRCRLAIKLYKNWRRDFEQETEILELLYGSIEGMMMKKQAEDAVRLYWIIREDFRAAFQIYLNRVMHNSMSKKAA